MTPRGLTHGIDDPSERGTWDLLHPGRHLSMRWWQQEAADDADRRRRQQVWPRRGRQRRTGSEDRDREREGVDHARLALRQDRRRRLLGHVVRALQAVVPEARGAREAEQRQGAGRRNLRRRQVRWRRRLREGERRDVPDRLGRRSHDRWPLEGRHDADHVHPRRDRQGPLHPRGLQGRRGGRDREGARDALVRARRSRREDRGGRGRQARR